jgi:hypothetical protein
MRGETMLQRQKFKVLVGVFSMVMLFGSMAQATVLTFDGDICDSFGGVCFNGAFIDQSYGDIAGKLDVVYIHREGSGPAIPDQSALNWWDTQYSDLTNVAWGGQSDTSGVAEIRLIPAPGFLVTLNSFDLGAWPNTSRESQTTLYDVSYNTLITFGPFTVDGQGHTSFAFSGAGAHNGLILQWGPSAFNVGIDNIDFTVQAVPTDVTPPTNPIPEPSTYLLFATGLIGLLGYGWRRKQTA